MPGWINLPACAALLSGRTIAGLSRPCPSLDRQWLLPLKVTPTTSALLSTSRLYSQRRRSRRRASTLRAFWAVGFTRTGRLRVGPHRRRATRGREASPRSRGPALARVIFAVATRAAATRRRSKVHCGVTCSVDPSGRVCSCRGLAPLRC